jgi:type II secretory pathway component PulF
MLDWLRQLASEIQNLFTPEARVKRDARLRERFFKDMDVLLRNGAGVQELLEKMLAPATDYGRRPKAIKALMIRDLMSRPHENIASSISRWTPPIEAMLVGIGFRTGRLSDTFAAIKLLMEKRSEALTYMIVAVPMPFVTFATATYMLVAMHHDFTPALVSLQPIPAWPAIIRANVYASAVADAVWLPLLALTAICAVAIPLSFTRLTGELRYRLDKFGPWKMYRNLTGSFFLYSIAMLISRGVGEKEALQQIRAYASPYLQERIDGFMRSVSNGRSLGRAMRESAYDYPDRDAIGFVELLGQQQGFADALLDYATEYLSDNVARLKSQLQAVASVCMLYAFAVSGLYALSSLAMQGAIKSLAH